ncbi:MAG: DnaB-like helicase N-terminal domain-containing protein [Pseudomonadota bacterium]
MSAFPNISQDMLPPHSNEAEQAVLGAILFDNMVYARVSRTLHAKHFYNPVHERIYGTISALIERGQLADAIVLKHRYTDEGV